MGESHAWSHAWSRCNRHDEHITVTNDDEDDE